MLDLKLIRSEPERVKQALARRGAAEDVDALLALDARRRELLPRIEGAQAERKTLSKQIGEAKQRSSSGSKPIWIGSPARCPTSPIPTLQTA
jgi:seryl-tRNA synthetase